MQRFVFVLIGKFAADRQQLSAQPSGLVKLPVPCRIKVQSPRCLKQLLTGICFLSQHSCELQGRFYLRALGAFVNCKRGPKL